MREAVIPGECDCMVLRKGTPSNCRREGLLGEGGSEWREGQGNWLRTVFRFQLRMGAANHTPDQKCDLVFPMTGRLLCNPGLKHTGDTSDYNLIWELPWVNCHTLSLILNFCNSTQSG